jgi:hypothetical protein
MPKKRPLRESLVDFVTHLDARAWRTVVVTAALFAVVGVILLIGRFYYGDEVNAFIGKYLGGAERAHWGLPAAILIFTLSAFVGAPQIVLIAACVVAFGPEEGFWFSWIATIVSGGVTFLVGRAAGADTLKRFSGATGGRFRPRPSSWSTWPWGPQVWGFCSSSAAWRLAFCRRPPWSPSPATA